MINTLAMTLPTGGPTVDFYQQWSQSLSPQPHIFLTLVMLFMHSVALIFYYLADGVLTAYSHSFELFGFLNIFLSPKSSVYQTWDLGLIIRNLFYLGTVAFGIMMLVQWIKFIATDGRKGREWPRGISITMAVILSIPLMVTLVTNIATSSAQSVMGNANSNIITKLWAGNSTDLKFLSKNNFDKDKYTQDDKAKVNKDKITGSDYHSVMSDAGYTDGLDNDQKKVFTKKIGGNNKLVDTTGGTLILGKTFADEYPVMKTNWLGIIAGEIVFIGVVCAAIIRIFISVYKMAFYAGTIVYFGLRDGTEGKRVQQILTLIEGQVTGIVMMPISLVFFFAWLDFSMDVIGKMKLDAWPFTILTLAALIAGFKGLFAGFELIEQWTGVRSGHNPVATMMLAGQGKNLIGGLAKSAKTNLGKGLNAISPAQRKKNREIGSKIVNGNPMGKPLGEDEPDNTSKSAKFAGGLGRAVGAMKNPGQLAKNTGRAAVSKTKSSVTGAVNNVKNSAKDYAGSVKDGFEGGQESVKQFNQRHTPVDANQSLPEAGVNPEPNVHDVLSKARSGLQRNAGSQSASGVTAPSASLVPTSIGTVPSSKSVVDSLPSSSTNPLIKEMPLPSQTGMTQDKSKQAFPTDIPVSQMTDAQVKAHDEALAKAAVKRHLEKLQQNKHSL
ncbi:hypothetical protein LNP18_06120 [Leuconostoc citreum]|uniref:pLS20_p028 family conjugation system transmembrane protein n=1 Tax=Leuconostoc citreum TaxID=33964 RepID=UPI00200AC321|nr:hypothetical protein [Leuconostoc citreum]MCK8605678.1 hypothetical protein [Leuconostoc citreum]